MTRANQKNKENFLKTRSLIEKKWNQMSSMWLNQVVVSKLCIGVAVKLSLLSESLLK